MQYPSESVKITLALFNSSHYIKLPSTYPVLQLWRELGLELASGATAVVPLDKDLASNRWLLWSHLAVQTGQSACREREDTEAQRSLCRYIQGRSLISSQSTEAFQP